MVAHQNCPSCSTANSQFAPRCRACGGALDPRPLPEDGGLVYEAAPRLAEVRAVAVADVADWPAAPPSPPSTIPFFLHPGAVSGPALAVSGPALAVVGAPGPPAPAGVPASVVVPPSSLPAALAPAPAPASPASEGGRGWGIRGGSTPDGPAWASAASLGGVAPGTAAPVYPATGLPPWAAQPDLRPSRVPRLAVLLVVVALAFAGGLWYFADGPGSSGLRTISVPPTLGGVAQNTNPSVAALTSQVESQMASAPGVEHAVIALYGPFQAGTTSYILAMTIYGSALTSSQLTTFLAGFDAAVGGDFAPSATVTQESGVAYRCGPDTLNGAHVSMCAWTDANVLGLVIGAPGVAQAPTLAAAEEARANAER